MLKSMSIVGVVAVFAIAVLSTPSRHHQAAAHSAPLTVAAIDIHVVPGKIDDYLTAIKEVGAMSMKEPGCREFNISVSDKDPNHVLVFEVYDNPAALEAHDATDHYKKYAATVKDMIAKRELRTFSAAAMNMKGK
jgi:(4S)-4-hydroxy-5-phosphonooxypentane-2,3-dione isomerase